MVRPDLNAAFIAPEHGDHFTEMKNIKKQSLNRTWCVWFKELFENAKVYNIMVVVLLLYYIDKHVPVACLHIDSFL